MLKTIFGSKIASTPAAKISKFTERLGRPIIRAQIIVVAITAARKMDAGAPVMITKNKIRPSDTHMALRPNQPRSNVSAFFDKIVRL